MKTTRRVFGWVGMLALAAILAAPAAAQSPQQFAADATRYMALGDSISAGYKAMPVTAGYAYRLYTNGVFDRIPHTLFANISAPGATSADVLHYQVPQALMPTGLHPQYITLTVGGNDLLSILAYLNTHSLPETMVFAHGVLNAYASNLTAILGQLSAGLPQAKIFVANQYPLPQIEAAVPIATEVIGQLNMIVDQVVAQFPNAYVVDVHSAFGTMTNLVEGDRPYASAYEVHPTNVGHRVIERAFAEVIAQNK